MMAKVTPEMKEFLKGLGVEEADMERYAGEFAEMLSDCDDEQELSNKIDEFVWKIRDSKL